MFEIQKILRSYNDVGSVFVDVCRHSVRYDYCADRENITFSVYDDFGLFCQLLKVYLTKMHSPFPFGTKEDKCCD